MSTTDASTFGEGRDAHGRFAPGNKGGPGNPFARQTAALRKEVSDFMAEGHLRPVVERLYADALAGNTAAARVLLLYAVGRPAPVVDPDELEAHELGVFRRSTANPSDAEPLRGYPAGVWNELAATLRPILAEVRHRTLGQMLESHLVGPGEAASGLSAGEMAEVLRHPALRDFDWHAGAAANGQAPSRPDAHGGPGADSKREQTARAANPPHGRKRKRKRR